MKRCPNCKTVFLDDSVICPYCDIKLENDNISKEKETSEPDKTLIEPPEKGKGIFAVIIYTIIFILFIMGIYYLYYFLSK